MKECSDEFITSEVALRRNADSRCPGDLGFFAGCAAKRPGLGSRRIFCSNHRYLVDHDGMPFMIVGGYIAGMNGPAELRTESETDQNDKNYEH
jgi:hypothetical protein